jgi:hypothetical protein
MEGAVFEVRVAHVQQCTARQVGEGASGADFYQVLEPGSPGTGGRDQLFEGEQHGEKSLNQNVFGKKVLVLPKPSDGLVYDEEAFSVTGDVFHEAGEGGLEVSGEVQFEPGNGVSGEGANMADSVLQFEDGGTGGTVVFDSGSDGTVVFGAEGEMELGPGTIFFLPGMVGEEQLEEGIGEP